MASVGPEGDSYDDALAESFNGLYDNELILRKGPWHNVEHVEWVMFNYVDWFDNPRIREALAYAAPAEFEAACYGSNEPETPPVCAMI